MKWCFVLIFVIGVQSRPRHFKRHATLGPENECLDSQGLTMKDIAPYVQKVTDLNNKMMGEYLVCVWKKRQMITPDGEVSGANIFRYLEDIYHKSSLSDGDKVEMRSACDECEKVKDHDEGVLAIKIKNCILEQIQKLSFLAKPKPSTLQ
ncbi:hypothetical protein PPYR_12889 [Photinus pyralis]|uniref:Uncharacterized protein n=1 Tax=Photinus pyralis TaxID=7054 RepID=A0A1Y1KZG0_PHOPY|nr:uncharacterized protein LOC116179176 [Photinus pyralis]KAB0793269.1 hypothetical protein PPYR_12889 [Photinus pyralis]